LSTIRGVLEDGSPGDVVFALDLLDQAHDERSRALVVGLLGHASPEVRRAAILRLERRRAGDASGALLPLAAADPEPSVRAAALTALAALDRGGASAEVLAAGLGDPQETVRRGALIGLLRRDGPQNTVASRQLESAATADLDEERAGAAQVIGETARADFAPLLSTLLQDRSLAVRRAAIPAAAKLRLPALWYQVARALTEPGLAGLATRALADGEDDAVAALAAVWDLDARSEVRARLARALGRVGGRGATALLWERLPTPDETVRHEIVAALVRCGHRPKESERPAIVALIEREAADAGWAAAGNLALRGESGLGLVAEALATEAAQGRDRILLLLSLLEDPETFLRVRSHLGDSSKEKRAYALEVLDLAIPSDLRGLLLPLFEGVGERARRGSQVAGEALSPLDRLRAILRRSDEWTAPWTRAVALYAAATKALDVESEIERIAASDGTGLVTETARAMLERLRSGGREERKPMLTIERVITLKAVDMFSRASEGVLAEVAGILEEMAVRAGDVVFEKGAAGDSMYVIVSGRVRVYDGERTIGELGPRDIFGELALLDPEPRLASISAVDDTTLLRLDREAFAELMAANIEIVRGVLHVLCERLRRASAERRA
jgi:HEAT repeat protein